MTNKELTFNDLPQVVAELRDEVSCMKALLLNLQNRPTQQRENRHRPVTPEQVAEYTNIPLATIYQKLANREIPGSKPGKRWVIYLDEIDKWLEANRKNPIPLTDEEINTGIRASHRHKSHTPLWAEENASSFDKNVRTKKAKVSKEEKQERIEDGEEVKELVVDAPPLTEASLEQPASEITPQEPVPIEEEPALISFEQICYAYPKPDKPGNFLNDAMRLWESFDIATRYAAMDGVKAYIERHPRYSDQVFLNRYLRDRLWQSSNPTSDEVA